MLDTNISKGKLNKINLNDFSIFILSIIVFLFLAITKKNFANFENIYSMIYGISMEFFCILGLGFLLILGEIDLSIGSTYGFIGALTGYCMLILNCSIWLSIVLALLVALLIGLINGFFIVKLKVNSIVMTLGMMILLQGARTAFTMQLGGATYSYAFRSISRFRFRTIHLSVLLMIATIIILELLLRKHMLFKKLYYIGEHPESSTVYGIDSDKLKIYFYIICGLTAGLAGIFSASRVGVTMPYTGTGLEFKMVTAAILGGASFFGGKGSIMNFFFGLFFLALILNGMVMFDINPDWQKFVIGAILVTSMAIDTKFNKKSDE